MNNKYILVIILTFILLQTTSIAQQQGFGSIKDKKYISLSGLKYNTIQDKKPITNILPVFSKKFEKNDYNLPLPFGVGINSLYYRQAYTASDLLLVPDSSSLVARADTLYQNTYASELIAQVKPDIWIFPFLNIYGIIGYTKGVISPNLVVPYIVIENIPIIDSIIIDSTFEIHDNISYVGLNYGIGATFSMGFGSFFTIIDYNYSVTNPTDLSENLHRHYFSPKMGVLLGSKNSGNTGAFWVGGTFMSNDQSFSGKIDIAEINPDLVKLLGEKATYSGTITAKQKWNMVIGGSWDINNANHLTFEIGFWERKQLSLGYSFRY